MKIFTTFCCAALALASALYSQGPADHMTVRFNTPVVVGETTLPAGDCDIRVMHGSSDTIILVFRSQAGPSVAAVASRLSEGDTGTEGNGSVVLNRRGNDLHLSQVLFPERVGYQLNIAE